MAVKDAVNRAYETTMAEGINYERRLFQSLFATEDQTKAWRPVENANRNFATSSFRFI
jgi:enoyl-CoA hydratase/carnithine racemase